MPASYPRFDPQASYIDEGEKLDSGTTRRTTQSFNKCYAKHRLCMLAMLWFILSKRYATLKNRHVGKCNFMQDKHTERPDLENYPDVPLYNTKAVVQKTGIAAPTLRAWERRYRILSPERAQNDYRLYSERDIAIIGWLKDRVDAGMSISQAIALFRHLEEEHHQLHRKGLPPESASPFQEMVSTPAVDGKLEMIAKGDEQGKDVTYNMRFVQERLLDAFNGLDEAAASRLMASVLAIYPVRASLR